MDIVDGTRIRQAAVTSQDEPAASTSSALPPSQPHPRLTTLLRAPADCKAVLTDAEKASVLVEAKSCLDKMRDKRDVDDKLILDARTGVQLAHVAAALALLCGYYTKRKGVLNPTAAAAAFGHPTSRPGKVPSSVTSAGSRAPRDTRRSSATAARSSRAPGLFRGRRSTP